MLHKEALTDKAEIEKLIECIFIKLLYFSLLQMPENATITYCVDNLICCKHTFSKCRQHSQYQSIDQSIVKLKIQSYQKIAYR